MSTDDDKQKDETRRQKIDRQQRDWQLIRQAVENLAFGTVTVHVQDGVVVQIDRMEKQRLGRP